MSTERTIAPYGAWESPVTTEMLTAGALRFEGIAVEGDDVYWVESRPDEGGRCAAMRLTADGAMSEVTTPAHNARTRVHEYGGGALAVSDGVAYFSNFSDRRLYRRPVDGSEAPAAITPTIAVRYADATVDDARGRLICVAEDHRRAGREAENLLVSVPTGGASRCPCTGASTSTPRRASAPTAAGSRGSAGTIPTCRGTRRSCGSRTWPPMAP